ncbi:MAG: hypothetical protein ACE5RI_04725 [Candidatus Nitrosomaritimum yanchengensis]
MAIIPIISKLNIYDTKSISCVICGLVIGEVDYDAEIIRPKCGQCSNPTLDPKDKMPYLIPH